MTKAGDLLALDAKLNFDDNALYRHPDVAKLRDPDEEDPRERAAKEIDLAYVGLDGNIGCMVNGAGLAMATLDMIQVCGGKPANFLDAGGGADKEKVKEAFKLILRDENVKAILVNIFGGIVRCDLIAEGVVAAAQELGVQGAAGGAAAGHERRARAARSSPRRASTSRRPRRCARPARRPSPRRRERGPEWRSSATRTRSCWCRASGKMGQFHARLSREYGTQVVGGVAPGKGGTAIDGIPVFDTVRDAVTETGANASVIFVPPPGAADAILEAADAGIALAVCITEGIPVLDMLRAKARAARLGHAPDRPELPRRRDARPVPHRHHAGADHAAGPGRRGLALGHAHLRGGRPALAPRHRPVDLRRHRRRPDHRHAPSSTSLALFEADPATKAVVMIGEIGGAAEETAAEFVRAHMKKPVVAFIAGQQRAAGQAHGPRRRDHRGRQGPRERQDRRARGRGRRRRALAGGDRRDAREARAGAGRRRPEIAGRRSAAERGPVRLRSRVQEQNVLNVGAQGALRRRLPPTSDSSIGHAVPPEPPLDRRVPVGASRRSAARCAALRRPEDHATRRAGVRQPANHRPEDAGSIRPSAGGRRAGLGEMSTRVEQHVGDRIPHLTRRPQHVNVTAIREHAPRAVKHPVHAARKARGDRLETASEIPRARRLDDHVDVIALDRVVDEPETPALASLPPAALQLGDEPRRAQ